MQTSSRMCSAQVAGSPRNSASRAGVYAQCVRSTSRACKWPTATCVCTRCAQTAKTKLAKARSACCRSAPAALSEARRPDHPLLLSAAPASTHGRSLCFQQSSGLWLLLGFSVPAQHELFRQPVFRPAWAPFALPSSLPSVFGVCQRSCPLGRTAHHRVGGTAFRSSTRACSLSMLSKLVSELRSVLDRRPRGLTMHARAAASSPPLQQLAASSRA